MHFLCVAGSLRETSSNAALLHAADLLKPWGVTVEHYKNIGQLPHFNPDDEAKPPAIIRELRIRIEKADRLLISCPEYACGIPGSFKNMLDWMVGSEAFPQKAVALFNASPRASASQKALRLVLETMSARIIDEACIEMDLVGKQMDGKSIVANARFSRTITAALEKFAVAIAASER